MTPIGKRADSAGAARYLDRARALAQSVRQKYGTKRNVIDGYLVEGRNAGGRRTATVIDLPGRFVAFGAANTEVASLLMMYNAPPRYVMDPKGEAPVATEQLEGTLSPLLGSYYYIGAPLTGAQAIQAGRAAEFEGGVVFPSILANAPVASVGGITTWANIAAGTTVWLWFHVEFTQQPKPLRSVSVSDATVRSMTGGYDLVPRGMPSAQTRMMSAPFPATQYHNGSLYVAVPVQKTVTNNGTPVTTNGGLWVFRVDYDDENDTAAIGWHHLLLPEQLGHPKLVPSADFYGPLPCHIRGATLAVFGDPARIVVKGVVRTSQTVAGRGATAPTNWLVLARCRAEFVGAAVTFDYSELNVVCGKTAPILASIDTDVAKIRIPVSPETLLVTPAGLVEASFAQVGWRSETDEGILSGTVSPELAEITVRGPLGTSVVTTQAYGWGPGTKQAGENLNAVQVTGTTGSVFPTGCQIATDRAFLRVVNAANNAVGFAVLTATGLGEVYQPGPTGIQMIPTAYQKERVVDNEVVEPWAVYFTSLDGAQPVGGIMRGTIGNIEFKPIPLFSRSGTFYMGNPLADMPYGDMRISG